MGPTEADNEIEEEPLLNFVVNGLNEELAIDLGEDVEDRDKRLVGGLRKLVLPSGHGRSSPVALDHVRNNQSTPGGNVTSESSSSAICIVRASQRQEDAFKQALVDK